MLSCSFFTREESELGFHKLLKTRDETGIAGGINKSASWVSKMFNPQNYIESALYRAAAILAAWMATSPARGRRALRLFVSYVERAAADRDQTTGGVILRMVASVEEQLAEVRQIVEDEPAIRTQMREVVRRYRGAQPEPSEPERETRLKHVS